MEFIAIRQRLDIIEKALGLVKAPVSVDTPPVPDEIPDTGKDEDPLE